MSFYSSEPITAYSSHHGLIDANSTIHKIDLNGLNPGQKYKYRILSTEILEFKGNRVLYGRTVSTNVYRSEPFRFTTADPGKNNFSFSVVNDIHEHADKLENLLKTIPLQTMDMVFFNGDMVNDVYNKEQLFKGFLDTSVRLFAREIPFIYVRGNHETRGPIARQVMDYFPTETGRFYYSFNHGPVCFIILDSGEDKPDSDIEYSGLADFDRYRQEQAEWLKKVVQTETFKNAKFKVVFSHMPLYGRGGWHGEQHIRKLWSPILNEAGVDLVLSGHTHRYAHIEPQKFDNIYTLIINGADSIMNAQVSDNQFKITIKKTDGSIVDTILLKN